MTPTRHVVRIDPELRDLIPRFLMNRRLDLDRLRAAAAGRDFEQARRIGHILKGAGGGYGFDEITRLGAEIERRAEAWDESFAALIDELADYLDGLDVTFE
jgi:HPt (histidine-containing phosphotransfer) domain-containing protein